MNFRGPLTRRPRWPRSRRARAEVSISILVLTFNEQVNVGGCLQSVRWSDDVLVLDSFSTDSTVAVAGQRGVRVVQRKFDNYAAQRNFGLQQPFKHPWVLMLDADERVPADLRDEMIEATRAAAPAVALFRMRRRDHLFGRWIRGASGYPTRFGRLARVGRVRVERPINEEYHADGELRDLRGHLDHFPFNKGFDAWIAKHDRYSSMEAQLRLEGVASRLHWPDLWQRDADGPPPRAEGARLSTAVAAIGHVHRPVHLPRRLARGTRRTHVLSAACLV